MCTLRHSKNSKQRIFEKSVAAINNIAEQAYVRVNKRVRVSVNKVVSKIDSMIRQFNRLFAAKKKRLPHTTKTAIASQVFCFSNFDFVVGLSISETGREFCQRDNVYRSPLFQNEQRRSETAFVDKSFIL